MVGTHMHIQYLDADRYTQIRRFNFMVICLCPHARPPSNPLGSHHKDGKLY